MMASSFKKKNKVSKIYIARIFLTCSTFNKLPGNIVKQNPSIMYNVKTCPDVPNTNKSKEFTIEMW
jgi:hypothetical protein